MGVAEFPEKLLSIKEFLSGTGAKISNLTFIGDYTVVGAGVGVAKSLPENCTAVEIPAKPIKFHSWFDLRVRIWKYYIINTHASVDHEGRGCDF